MGDLRTGWPVLTNDGRRFGVIKRVGQNYLHVSRGGGAPDAYVPSSAIGNVDRDSVFLNLARGEAESMGWEQQPRDEDALETEPGSDLHRHV